MQVDGVSLWGKAIMPIAGILISPNSIAFWVSFLSSIVSLVLSIIAIWFTIKVNERSEKVNDAMLSDLRDIKNATLEQTSQIKDLIRDAWKKVYAPEEVIAVSHVENEVVRERTDESLDELRELMNQLIQQNASKSENGNTPQPATSLEIAQLGAQFERLERSIDKIQRTSRSASRMSSDVEYLYRDIDRLPLRAQTVLRVLPKQFGGRPIMEDKLPALLQSSLGNSIQALLKSRILIEIEIDDTSGAKRVIIVNPSIERRAFTALDLLDPPPRSELNQVTSLVRQIAFSNTDPDMVVDSNAKESSSS